MTEYQTTQPPKLFNVLLIGDSCIDRYRIGTVDRLSPEAPVPVVKVVSEFTLPGMAANVKNNLINLGVDVDFITNDSEITKTRYIDQRSNQHLLRVDDEPSICPWTGYIPKSQKDYNAIVISDYDKGFLSYEIIEKIIKDNRCPIFIDTKKKDLSRFSADNVYVKINESEYKNRYSIPKNLIVTLGDKGAMLKSFHTEVHYGTEPVEVMDVCGCGDTFLAALTVEYLYTNNINQSIIFANLAAGVTVQHRGNYAPTYEEISYARH